MKDKKLSFQAGFFIIQKCDAACAHWPPQDNNVFFVVIHDTRTNQHNADRNYMARTIYDKPTRALLKDMVTSWNLQPGQVFTAKRAIEWFEEHYPRLKPGSITAHLVQASTNDRSRLHHPSTNTTDDLLFRVAPRQYRLYEAGKDPAPIHEMVDGDVALDDEASAEEAEDHIIEASPGSSEFLLERDLQRYLAENLDCIEPGLKLYEDDGLTGIEYDAGGRRIDILATDATGGFVVIELKVSRGYDRVVGQLLRYINWVRKELADPGQPVRGIIVCRSISEDLCLACASIKEVELFEYKLSVTVKKVPVPSL
ncbi:endonuclease NucS [Pseudomonas sp. 39004]|uniref:endonuclease NucS domain-containing protein n=1 Tax=unclassified Pseudomonas TaxID=196821 RepID=UPI00236381B4|nr:MULTISPECIES: endonuclease NucS domain-containing protein [unclassified Pseudomonas]MDD1959034.1 endonuclease NucS [Pseudomonas sp. 39004]MDD2062944.1 endonuclease NucS [Pseudomonas sp. 25571]